MRVPGETAHRIAVRGWPLTRGVAGSVARLGIFGIFGLSGLIGLSGWATSAWAQTSPAGPDATGGALGDRGTLALEQSWVQERNPLRLPPGQSAVGDAASVSTIDGAYRGSWGRQRWSGMGRWSSTHYADEAALDHEAYRLGATLDLQTAGDLGARGTWRQQREPLEGQLRLDPSTGQRRQQTVEQYGAALLWGLQRRWTMELQWQQEQLQPNRPQPWWPGYAQDVWRLQLRGEAAGAVVWALGRRELMGVQAAVPLANGTQPALDYRQALWEGEWTWVPRPGDAWTVRAATGQGSRTWRPPAGSDPASADPSTRRIELAARSLHSELRWRPGSHWSVQAQWSRDQGQQAQASASWIDSAGLVLQGASDVRQARVAVQWDFSHRASVYASWSRIDRIGRQSWTLESLSAALPLADQAWQDRLDRAGLGVSWQLAQGLSLRCAAQQDERRGTPLDNRTLPGSSPTVLWRDSGVQCGLRWVALRVR